MSTINGHSDDGTREFTLKSDGLLTLVINGRPVLRQKFSYERAKKLAEDWLKAYEKQQRVHEAPKSE